MNFAKILRTLFLKDTSSGCFEKINDQLMEIRKSRPQEYMLNSNMLIIDSKKN